jgi:hypothetical protein
MAEHAFARFRRLRGITEPVSGHGQAQGVEAAHPLENATQAVEPGLEVPMSGTSQRLEAQHIRGGARDVIAPPEHTFHTVLPTTAPGVCYRCGGTRRWRSIYGALLCTRCHPPADAALVAAWEGEV